MSIKKIINLTTFGIFFKEKKLEYPPEFFIVNYSESSLKSGIEDNQNKVIIRYRTNFRTGRIEPFKYYGYSDSIIYKLRNVLKIPGYDNTDKEIKFPIYDEINLNEISYEAGK